MWAGVAVFWCAAGVLFCQWYMLAQTRVGDLVVIADIGAVPCCGRSVADWRVRGPLRARCREHYRYDELNISGKASEGDVRKMASNGSRFALYPESWDTAPAQMKEIAALLGEEALLQDAWSKDCWFGHGTIGQDEELVMGYCPAGEQLWARVMERGILRNRRR